MEIWTNCYGHLQVYLLTLLVWCLIRNHHWDTSTSAMWWATTYSVYFFLCKYYFSNNRWINNYISQ